ncbi:MAG: ATP-dependent DNA helicase RecG [Clostridia bacterium]|nr:ATP-dependent DNA helicase RecG [Clostridia bacterium]
MKPEDSVKTIKGIGNKKQEALLRLGISEAGDIPRLYPRSYQDRRKITGISGLYAGESFLVRARVVTAAAGRFVPKRGRILRLLVSDETGRLEIVFFNAAYLSKALEAGSMYDFYGRVTEVKGRLIMTHPEFSKVIPGTSGQGIVCIYPLTSGISQNEMHRLQKLCREELEEQPDFIPAEILEKYSLPGLKEALEGIHFPSDGDAIRAARKRFAFEELFLFQAGIWQLKMHTVQKTGGGICFDSDVDTDAFMQSFPYPMTNAQNRVITEILSDMRSPKCMNRLVQGDVGSGKTAVAETALYEAVKSGWQGVLMAPTELLAMQHFEGISAHFESFGIKTVFLGGNMKASEKRSSLEKIASGEADVVIGTHAVIQPGVVFKKLGLVITDEQHRFGVNQRMMLSEKGENPDILVMTATPIPRTLAVVLYGDTDVSAIDELPPGRQKIITRAIDQRKRKDAYDFLEKKLMQGEQAYIVAPLIEDSESIDARSAEGLFEELSKKFSDYSPALLHGAMKQQEKDSVMTGFHEGRFRVLISTVVIEVGINVPNATVMLIENAERFGLAQLHQLRGRVGRGAKQSYCILISSAKTDVAKERAKTMENSSDGFYIAEKDLMLRGPGEFFGTRQHGLPEFKMADLTKHMELLKAAGEEAKNLLSGDPLLSQENHRLLAKEVRKLFTNGTDVNL